MAVNKNNMVFSPFNKYNPEKKASRFLLIFMNAYGDNFPLAKQSTLGAIDLFLADLTSINEIDDEHKIIKEWTAVKKYIKKLDF